MEILIFFSRNFSSTSNFISSPDNEADVFVLKLASSGSHISFSTIMGGPGNETSTTIALDSQGNACVTGSTNSLNFPSSGVSSSTINQGSNKLFFLKLSENSSILLYSRIIGTLQVISGMNISVDASNNICIAGNGNSNLFVMKIFPVKNETLLEFYFRINNIDINF